MAYYKSTKNFHLRISTDWTLLTIKNFIDVLMEITLCKTIKELKGHKLPDFIWLTMESKLNINYKKLKQLWYQRLHMQLFCVEPIYLNHIKIKLIKYLHKNEITDLKEINWHKVILLFDGVTREYIYRIFTNLIKLGRMKVHSTKFSDQLHFLYNKYIPYLVNNFEDKMLPRLLYNNGNIVYNDTDLSKIIN